MEYCLSPGLMASAGQESLQVPQVVQSLVILYGMFNSFVFVKNRVKFLAGHACSRHMFEAGIIVARGGMFQPKNP